MRPTKAVESLISPQTIDRAMNEMCDLAAAQTMPRFRTGLHVENKAETGFDPVTIADQAAEAAMRRYVVERFPDHGFVGEEEAPHQPESEYCWIVDPVDGTRSFICGLPSWGTLVGLVHKGDPVAGIMHQPFTGERYVANGSGSFLSHNGARTPLATSRITRIEEAAMLTTSPFLFEPDRISAYRMVADRCRLVRYGFDCYGYAMVASGHADLVIESGLKSFDVAALIPLIRQAGGVITNWENGPAIGGGSIIAAANRELHEQALEILSIRS